MLTIGWHVWAQQVNTKQLPGTASREAAGRYQLFQGNYTVISMGTAIKMDAVFKLDSDTGKAWLYREGLTQDGKLYQRWENIQE